MITREEIDNYVQLKERIEAEVSAVLNLKIYIESGRTSGYAGEIGDIQFENYYVHVRTVEESNCSCCSDETHGYSFPIHYLLNSNWVEEAKEDVARKKAEAERKEQETRELQAKEKEEHERKELERLQAKYGGEQR